MSPLAQQLVVYATIALASAWLLRRWLRRSKTSACDRCGPATTPPARSRGIRPDSLRVLR